MSVENEARPQGPSKVSRRNLIAGAAVAVPAAAVLNASSAWAKPVVSSLIGMPALKASVNYRFDQLFTAYAPRKPNLNKDKNKLNVDGFRLKNKSGETLLVSIVASVTKGASSAFLVTMKGQGGDSLPVTLTNLQTTKDINFEITSNPAGAALTAGTYSILLTISATGGGVMKSVTYGIEVTIA